MKLLLFSDLHQDVATARKLVEMARQADVVVGAGDFGSVRRGVDLCFKVLKAIDRPAVLVPGNNESLEELTEASRCWPQAKVLHGTGTEISGVSFFGLGGGIPVTPFGSWSYDFTEEQAAELLKDCPETCVLVSHSPPQGAVDVSSRGQNLGSTAVRDVILRKNPRLVVCGHIHESGGKATLVATTPIVNAGPTGIMWDLP